METRELVYNQLFRKDGFMPILLRRYYSKQSKKQANSKGNGILKALFKKPVKDVKNEDSDSVSLDEEE